MENKETAPLPRLPLELFERWNALNLAYCHWKGNSKLARGLRGETDLDIYLSPKDREQGEAVLREKNFLFCRTQLGAELPEVYDWVGMDPDTGILLHVHLHYQLVTGRKGVREYTLPWAEEALESAVADPATGVKVMDPSLELIQRWIRVPLERSSRSVWKARLKHAFRLTDKESLDLAYLRSAADRERTEALLTRLFKQPEPLRALLWKEKLNAAEFLSLRAWAKKELKPCRRGSAASAAWQAARLSLALKARALAGKVFHAVLIRRKVPAEGPGRLITFIGQDGSGKTTVTREITRWLSWKMDARTFYLGAGKQYHSLWNTLIRRLKKYRKIGPVNAMVGVFTALDCVSIAKHGWKNLNRALCFVEKGGIALTDRFPQTLVRGYNDGPRIRESVMKKVPGALRGAFGLLAAREEKYVARSAAIQPDLVFKLMLTPEESMRRKPGELLEGVRRKHEFIKTWNPGKKTLEIDATQDYAQELLIIRREIWSCLLQDR